MAEIGGAFGGPEVLEGCEDGIERARSGLPEQRLDLGEGPFDAVEVWAVGRKVEQAHARIFEALPDAVALVGGQFVADDDAAGRQFGDEVIGQSLPEDAAGHPRWTFHFVPTSCSWLDADEGFFAKLTRRRLKNGVFHSVVDLQAAINRFIKEHNQQPRPFVWRTNPIEIIAAVRHRHKTMESVH